MKLAINPYKQIDFSTVVARKAMKAGLQLARVEISLGGGFESLAIDVNIRNPAKISIKSVGCEFALTMPVGSDEKFALGELLRSSCSEVIDSKIQFAKINRSGRHTLEQTLAKAHYREYIEMGMLYVDTGVTGDLRARIGLGIDDATEQGEMLCFTLNIFHDDIVYAEKTEKGFQILIRGPKKILVGALKAFAELFGEIADFQYRIMFTDVMRPSEADYARTYVLSAWFRAKA